MEQATQMFAAVLFLAVGLSHLLQPAAWVDFFQKLAERGRAGAVLEGFLYLPFGALIVGFHNVWRWPDVLLTLIGWAQVLKGTLRFVAPDVGLRAMRMVSLDRLWQLRAAGVLSLGLSGLLWYLRFGP